MARNRWFPDDEEEDEVAPPPIVCWLCERDMGDVTELHHPVPKSRGGRATVPLHPICHQTIHANLSNAELAKIGEDVGTLRQSPNIERFLDWVANKPSDFHAPTKREGGPRDRGGDKRRR